MITLKKATYIFHALNSSSARCGRDIDQQNFTLFDVFNFVVLVIFCPNNSLKNCSFNINLNENLRHLIWMADDMSNHIVRSSELRINFHTYCQKTARNCIHQMVLVSLQSGDLGSNFGPVCLASLSISSNVTWSNCNLFTNSQTSL